MIIKVKGFSAESPELLGTQINQWLTERNFYLLDVQYRVLNCEGSYSKRFSALVTYKEGEMIVPN